jgi:transposase-like protein
MVLPDQKKALIEKVLTKNVTVTAAAREVGVARKTIYEWIALYNSKPRKKEDAFVGRYKRAADHHLAKYPQFVRKLKCVVTAHPQWSIRQYCLYLTKKGADVSHIGVYGALKRLDLTTVDARVNYSQVYSGPGRLEATLKLAAVKSALSGERTISELAQEHGVPRKTIYYWINKYQNSSEQNLNSFDEAYVRGKDHPLAVYPDIETDLLVHVANNPELSMKALAGMVEVSVWTVWKVLGRHNLNYRTNRILFSRQLRKREVKTPIFSPSNLSGFVAKQVELLKLVTRKIPKLHLFQLQEKLAITIQKLLLLPFLAFFNSLVSLMNETENKLAGNFANINIAFSSQKEEYRTFTMSLYRYIAIRPVYSFYYLAVLILAISSFDLMTQMLPAKQLARTIVSGEVFSQDFKNQFILSMDEYSVSGAKSYKTTDILSFDVKKQVGFAEIAGKNIGKVLGSKSTPVTPQVQVKDPQGNIVDGIELQEKSTGTYLVNLDGAAVKPGKYSLNVTDKEGRSVSQEFNWGTLALNTPKTVYAKGETVEFSMTVLGSDGMPVCDADLVISLYNKQKRKAKLITTADGEIVANKGCADNKKTIEPDYSGSFVVEDEGEYEIEFMAVVAGKLSTITSGFEVTSDKVQDFEVVRAAPVRVGPGEDYPVIINVKANRDYKGRMTDTLPKNFLVKPFGKISNEAYADLEIVSEAEFTVKVSENNQIVIWDVDLKSGENYSFSYEFSDLGEDWKGYYLGPVVIDGSEVDKRWDLRPDPKMPVGNVVGRLRYGSLRAEDRVLQLKNGKLKVSMPKAHFGADETPSISLEGFDFNEAYRENESGILQRILGYSREAVSEKERNRKIYIAVTDSDNRLEYETEVDAVDGSISFPTEDLKPGKHRVIIRDNDTGNFVEQTFLYGVLALNFNKTKYAVNENAYIQMASLDDRGNTNCSSNLQLTVSGPDENLVFRVHDQTIVISDTCGANNVSAKPDYYVNLPVNKTGEYRMTLTNLENGFSVNGTIQTHESTDFSLERIGATRINPFKSAYMMSVNVAAKEAFTGTLTERVPLNFEIEPSSSFKLTRNDDHQIIAWNVNVDGGSEASFEYRYQAPKVSPELYLLGVLELTAVNGVTVHADTRQWQLASDAQFARPDSDVTVGTWTTAPLYSKINTTTPDDSTLVRSANNPSNAAFEVGLSDVEDPQASTGHILRVRERMQQSGGGSQATTSVTIALRQGSTTIASQTYTHAAGDLTWYTRALTLTSTQADAITNYNDLRINVNANKTGGTRTGWVEVSWAEFETPDPPPNSPPTLSISQPDGVDDTIAQDGSYTVEYSLSDTDDTVTANFYYDTNNTGLDGTAIAGCANRPEGVNATCTWNTTGVAPGTYYVYGITTDGINPQVSAYSSGVVTINAAPTLTIAEPDGVDDTIIQDGNFTVQYDLSDADDTVTANFYYDTDNTGLDGTLISGCQNQPEGTNATCVWNTTGVTPGTYYVYGVTTDSVNPEVSAYSSGVVTINAAPTINIDEPDGIDDTIVQDSNFTVQYDLSDADDTVTADFYYDTNNTGLDGTAISGCQNRPEGVNATCVWNTTGVAPGTYYVYGITTDGFNPQVSVYSSGVVTINARPN